MYSAVSIIAIIFGCLCILAAYLYGSLALSLIAIVFVASSYLYFAREQYVAFEDEKVHELHQRLASVFPESTRIRVSGSNQSMTIDKNHIYLCIKDEHGHYYDDNSLMHVLLHEYAHVLCDEIDTEEEHKPKFRGIFARLIQRAAQAGIYDPSKPMISNYCGYK